MPSAVSAESRPAPTVLTIHWGSADYPANLVTDAGIRQTFIRSDRPIEYFAEYLESDAVTNIDASLALRDYIRRKYKNRRIDVVIATAGQALRFVLDYRRDLFPDARIVFSALTAPDDAVRRAGGITGVVYGMPHAETLKIALMLHPSTQRVFVVARSKDKVRTNAVRSALNQYSRRVELTYLDENTVPGLLAAVKALPARSVILYIWHWQSDPGSIVYEDEIARLVTNVSPVPVYGTSDFYVGSGIVGGVLRSTRDTGRRLAEMVIQILDGTRAEDIPIENARLVPTFDWRQIQRWAVDPSRLPAGSVIRFRVPTAWESYRSYVVATVAVIGAQLLLIAGLLTQRRKRRRAEQTIRTRETTLRLSYERIRQLTGRLLKAQETARAAIARELHDDVCQQLVGVSMSVSTLKVSCGHMPNAETQHALSELEDRALGMIDGVRRLSHDLHPASLRLVGLVAALQTHCVEVEQRHDVQVSFAATGDLTDIDPDVALSLFRIAQEALRNGVVHGDARRLAVSLARARSGEHVDLTVSDDGRGFDLEAVRHDNTGLGLVSIEERAHLLGGDVQILTQRGRGTKVRVRVPATAAVAAEHVDADMLMPGVHAPHDTVGPS
jgi:signal transduction histidine kinase